MIHARRALGGSLVVALVVASWGCGEDAKPTTESSNAEAKVSGTVKVHGKPMTSGEVSLNPANYLRKDAKLRTGTINKDGTFEVTTLVGQNTVKVTGPEISKEPQLGYAMQTIDVKDGEPNTLNIELPPPAQAAGDAAKTKPLQ